MNKSVLTNIIAILLVAAGIFWRNPYQSFIFDTGIFALAGGITNWLAIYILFEKVPGLYGSGVITARFDDFKSSIRSLVMNQFFNADNIERFLSEKLHRQLEEPVDFSDTIQAIEFDSIYQGLTETIMASSFGSMLSMFGGAQALEPLKQPFIDKMKVSLIDLGNSEAFQHNIKANIKNRLQLEELHSQIDLMVQARLDELTPLMVKQIIQHMIKEHLSWLVVWGGVFGGIIGLLNSTLKFYLMS